MYEVCCEEKAMNLVLRTKVFLQSIKVDEYKYDCKVGKVIFN